MLRGMAERHKAQFEAFVRQAGQEVEVRHPAIPTSTGSPGSKVLGKRTTPLTTTDIGQIYYPMAVVSSGYRQVDYEFGGMPASIASIGKRDPSMVVLRCSLADAQEPGASPFGDTIFHGAKAVIVQGDAFEVIGIDRSGLAPVGPYILWVGLRRIGVAT